MIWTKTELFRLTFAERIAESKVRTQRNAQRKFSLSDWLSPNQKRHFTFWIKFGLGLKCGLSERLSEGLIQKVKSPIVCIDSMKELQQKVPLFSPSPCPQSHWNASRYLCLLLLFFTNCIGTGQFDDEEGQIEMVWTCET